MQEVEFLLAAGDRSDYSFEFFAQQSTSNKTMAGRQLDFDWDRLPGGKITLPVCLFQGATAGMTGTEIEASTIASSVLAVLKIGLGVESTFFQAIDTNLGFIWNSENC